MSSPRRFGGHIPKTVERNSRSVKDAVAAGVPQSGELATNIARDTWLPGVCSADALGAMLDRRCRWGATGGRVRCGAERTGPVDVAIRRNFST